MWPQTADVIPAKGFKLLCGRNTPTTAAKGSQEEDIMNNARIRILKSAFCFNEKGNTFGTCVRPQGFTKCVVLPFVDTPHKKKNFIIFFKNHKVFLQTNSQRWIKALPSVWGDCTTCCVWNIRQRNRILLQNFNLSAALQTSHDLRPPLRLPVQTCTR